MKEWIKTHSKKLVGGAVLAVAGTVFALSGAPAAVGAALVDYAQFNSSTRAKVDNVRAFVATSSADTVIEHIGGQIGENTSTATPAPADNLGTVLPGIDMTGFSGDFIATISGQVDRTTAAATPGKAIQPQFSLWRDCDNDGNFEWKTNAEGITSPNATIPDQKNRSVTINGTAKLHVYKACHTKVVAFGYASDGSSAGSGELTAAKGVTVTLVPYR